MLWSLFFVETIEVKLTLTRRFGRRSLVMTLSWGNYCNVTLQASNYCTSHCQKLTSVSESLRNISIVYSTDMNADVYTPLQQGVYLLSA